VGFLPARRFLAFYRRQMAFSGISEASGRQIFGTYFYSTKNFPNISGVEPVTLAPLNAALFVCETCVRSYVSYVV